jgi:hypothetical protein
MKIAQSILLFSLVLFISGSCHQTENDSLFQLIDDTGISFENKVVDNKEENSFQFRNFYNGGVATGDLNNDGLADVISLQIPEAIRYLLIKAISNSKTSPPTRAWAKRTVEHRSDPGRYPIDGWLDIYIYGSGHMLTDHRKNQLFINNHDLTFTESAAAYNWIIRDLARKLLFDYDLDGTWRFFLIDNSPIPFNTPVCQHAGFRHLPGKFPNNTRAGAIICSEMMADILRKLRGMQEYIPV